jgi:hypothetical protein
VIWLLSLPATGAENLVSGRCQVLPRVENSHSSIVFPQLDSLSKVFRRATLSFFTLLSESLGASGIEMVACGDDDSDATTETGRIDCLWVMLLLCLAFKLVLRRLRMEAPIDSLRSSSKLGGLLSDCIEGGVQGGTSCRFSLGEASGGCLLLRGI